MSVLNPLLLWGLALGALPIIIHLLSRRRYRVVRWAAMDFLLAAVAERARHVRFQDMGLLALRTAVLLIAALAVARPVLAPSTAGALGLAAGGADAVLVLDTSYSMSTSVAAQTRMEEARRRAHELLATLPTDARLGVVYMDDRARTATESLTADRTRLARAIDDARVSATTTDFAPALRAALDLLKTSSAAHKQIFLLTDAQSGAFARQEGVIRELLNESDPNLGFIVLPVSNGRTPNLAITQLAVRTRAPGINVPVQLEVHVADVGEPATAQAAVELYVDGRKVDRRTVALEDRRGVVTFHHAFTAGGLYPLEVRLEPDAVAMDNQRYAVVYIPEAIDVIIAAGTPPAGAGASADVFLRAALAAGSGEPHAESALPFSVRPAVSPDRLAAALDSQAWALILADPGALPTDALHKLDHWTAQGGVVLIAAGPEWAATLGTFRSGQGLAGAWLSDLVLRHEANEGSVPLHFDPESLAPLPGSDADAAADPSDRTGSLIPLIQMSSPGIREAISRVNVFSALQARPAASSKWSTALRFTDGRPALLLAAAQRSGSADPATGTPSSVTPRLALLTTSLDASWTDLPYRPAMVPMIHDLLTCLLRHRLIAPVLRPRERWMPPVATTASAAALNASRIHTPGGNTLEAGAFLVDAGDERRLALDRTSDPGIYRLDMADAGSADATRAVAVNIDTAESDQSVLTAEQLEAIFPAGRVRVIAPDVPLDRAVLSGLAGSEIWPLLAFLILLMLAAETLLAFWFGRQKQSTPAAPVAADAARRPLTMEGVA